MPGSPFNGDQRPHRLSRPNPHTHPHGTRTPSHTHRMPNLFRLGTQQDAKFHRHMRHPPHVGFQKRPRVPSSPPSFMNLKGQEGSRTGVCAAGLSLKKQLASSFMPPPQKRRGLDMWPRGLTPTQEIRGEKGQRALSSQGAGGVRQGKKGRVGRVLLGANSSKKQTPQSRDTSRRKPPNLPSPQMGPTRDQGSMPARGPEHPQPGCPTPSPCAQGSKEKSQLGFPPQRD